jgi:hypothetical protein
VGFFQASKLKSVDPSNGAVQILCDAPGGASGAWNNRGTIIFTGCQMGNPLGGDIGMFKVPASGGEPQLVTKGNAPTFWLSALPDGDHFLYFLLGSSEPRLAFGRTVVLRYRFELESRRLAPATINLKLAAVRRLAYEASDNGLLNPDLAAGIRRGERGEAPRNEDWQLAHCWPG